MRSPSTTTLTGIGRMGCTARTRAAAARRPLELLQGTSMAAPHVSGVIALMLRVDADLSPENIDDLPGDGTLTISDVSADVPWLSATPTDVDADSLGRYTLVVDRTGVPTSAAARSAVRKR